MHIYTNFRPVTSGERKNSIGVKNIFQASFSVVDFNEYEKAINIIKTSYEEWLKIEEEYKKQQEVNHNAHRSPTT